MEGVKSHQELIEQELNALKLPKEPANLYEPIRYILGLSAKRMRPVLTLLAAQMFGIGPRSVLKTALGIEIFHNFTLVHDDIMDAAPLRRGEATVHEKWNQNIAILVGDLMFIKAYQLLAECSDQHRANVLTLFSDTATLVCEGQQLDMDFEKRDDVSIEEYMYMIERKTAVLLGCCLQLGALQANARNGEQEHIYAFGKHMGIAFQLQDDILDAFAETDKFGKQLGGDILVDKKTHLLIQALQEEPEATRAAMALSGNDKVQQVLAIYERIGARAKAEQEMQAHFNKAMSHLDIIEVEPSKKEPLMQLANSLLVRKF